MGLCQTSLPKYRRPRGPPRKPWQDTENPEVADKSVVTVHRDGGLSFGEDLQTVTESDLRGERQHGHIYLPAVHGSKPIPVYDARDWGDHR